MAARNPGVRFWCRARRDRPRVTGLALEPAQAQGQLEPDPRFRSGRHFHQSRKQFGKFLGHPDGMFPYPATRVLQRFGQDFGIEGGEPFQGIQRVQAAFGRLSVADDVLELGGSRELLPLDQQALRREPPPAVGMGEKADQTLGAGSGQRGLFWSRSGLLGRDDPVDSAPVGSGIEVQIPLDGLRNRLGVLHELSIDVHDVEVSVPAGGELNGPEPGIGGSQEFPLLFFRRSAGREADAARRQQVPVNQVAGDSSV